MKFYVNHTHTHSHKTVMKQINQSQYEEDQKELSVVVESNCSIQIKFKLTKKNNKTRTEIIEAY